MINNKKNIFSLIKERNLIFIRIKQPQNVSHCRKASLIHHVHRQHLHQKLIQLNTWNVYVKNYINCVRYQVQAVILVIRVLPYPLNHHHRLHLVKPILIKMSYWILFMSAVHRLRQQRPRKNQGNLLSYNF